MPISRNAPLRTVAVGVVACGVCLSVPMTTASAAAPLPALKGVASASFVGANYDTTVQDPNGTENAFALKVTAALTAAGLDLAGAEQSKAAADSLDAVVNGAATPLQGPIATSTAPPGGTANEGPTSYDVPLDSNGASAASVSGLSQTATTRTVTDVSTETGTTPVAGAGTTGGTFDVAPTGTIDPTSSTSVAIRQAIAKTAAAQGQASPAAIDAGSGQFSATGGSTSTGITIGGGGTAVTSSASTTAGAVTLVSGLLAIQVSGPATLSATANADPSTSTATYTPPSISYDFGGTGTFTPLPAGGFTAPDGLGLTLSIQPGALQKSVNGQTIDATATAATVTLSIPNNFSVTADIGQLAVSATVPAAVVTTPPTTAPPTNSGPGLADTGAHDALPLTWIGITVTLAGAGLIVATRRRTRPQH